MASKRLRPILAHNQQRKGTFKMSRLVKRAIWITVILALAEIIVLVFMHYADKQKTTVVELKQPTEIQQQTIKDSAVVPVPAENKVAVNTVKPTADTPAKPAQLLTDTIAKTGVSSKKDKTVKQVTSRQMVQILNDIRLAKLHANVQSKCVQIRVTGSSNVENAFKIAAYLKQNGYTMAGRETIAGNVKGIQIVATTPCIKLTIGTL